LASARGHITCHLLRLRQVSRRQPHRFPVATASGQARIRRFQKQVIEEEAVTALLWFSQLGESSIRYAMRGLINVQRVVSHSLPLRRFLSPGARWAMKKEAIPEHCHGGM
jgi:hypothetical protein